MDELENRVQEVKDLLSYFIKQRDFVKKIGEVTEAWDRLIVIQARANPKSHIKFLLGSFLCWSISFP